MNRAAIIAALSAYRIIRGSGVSEPLRSVDVQGIADAVMAVESRAALEAALVGFNASAEGFNGECAYEGLEPDDNGRRQDPISLDDPAGAFVIRHLEKRLAATQEAAPTAPVEASGSEFARWIANAETPFAEGGLGDDLYKRGSAYLADYVLSTDGADYEPNEFERALLEDAFAGLMQDEALFGPIRTVLATLRPQPSGETREAVAELIEAAIVRHNPTIPLDSTLDDADAILALLSARPLALGGQHSTKTDFPPDDVLACVEGQNSSGGCKCRGTGVIGWGTLNVHRCSCGAPINRPRNTDEWPAEPQVGRAVYERIEKLIDAKPGTPEGDELSFLAFLVESVEEVGGYDGPSASTPAPTTPARAEAQDEGAAGEWPALAIAQAEYDHWIKEALKHKRPKGLRSDCENRDLERARIAKRILDKIAAHPSPTPAADADRVRLAVEALEEAKNLLATGDWKQQAYAVKYRITKALAALKSTAAKE